LIGTLHSKDLRIDENVEDSRYLWRSVDGKAESREPQVPHGLCSLEAMPFLLAIRARRLSNPSKLQVQHFRLRLEGTDYSTSGINELTIEGSDYSTLE
jgi:hypothetical protein